MMQDVTDAGWQDLARAVVQTALKDAFAVAETDMQKLHKNTAIHFLKLDYGEGIAELAGIDIHFFRKLVDNVPPTCYN